MAGPDSFFVWHTDDLDLASINFMHWGSRKLWIVVHASSSAAFRDALIRDFSPTDSSMRKSN